MQIHRVEAVFHGGREEGDRNNEKRFEEEPGGLYLIRSPEDNENSRTSVDLTEVWRDKREINESLSETINRDRRARSARVCESFTITFFLFAITCQTMHAIE